MKNTAYLLVAAALILPVGGVLLDRSMAASATQISAPADTKMAHADFASTRPIDADYAVPGVLDDRSWKPEYNRMPATRVASYARHRAAVIQPDEPMPVTVADAAAPSLPQGDAVVAAPVADVVEAPSPQP
jgi:hypothetical protein